MGKCDNLKPMAKWLEEPELEGDCKPCRLAVIIGDYQELLEKSGYQSISGEIASKIESDGPDPILSLAQFLDQAKEQVPESVRSKLLQLDCMAQTEPI